MNAEIAREAMVQQQLLPRGIVDPGVLAAMRVVPREKFVAPALAARAYDDAALDIECGQTISQPFIVAWMIQAAALHPGDRVLEIGSGSGYAAAVLSRVVAHVWAIERHDALARLARARLSALGYDNVEIATRDGTPGWPEVAPFNAILVSAGGPSVPPALVDQLADGGRLVMPVGRSPSDQRLIRLTKRVGGNPVEDDLGGVRFVPLIGEFAWPGTGITSL